MSSFDSNYVIATGIITAVFNTFIITLQTQYNMLACSTLNTVFSQEDLENAWIYCLSQCKLMGWHHLRIQGARKVAWSKFHTEEPQY
jgi:hypothetical protein